MKEVWKDVLGYESLYQVSNLGRVKSVTRIVPHGRHNARRMIKERILRPGAGVGKGYLHVVLCQNGITAIRQVQHLVLEAFIGPCPDGMECRHFPDSDPTNNRLDNLSWGTRQENANDRIIHGTTHKGERHPLAKLNWSKVRQIRKLYDHTMISITDLATRYKVSLATISMIIHNKTWKE